MDVDEQLTDVDEFLIALWQEMKVPYMGTFQFLMHYHTFVTYRPVLRINFTGSVIALIHACLLYTSS